MQRNGRVAPYQTTPRPRAQPGLLIASEFAVALGLALMQHRHVLAMSWSETPFAGAVVRPDAGGMLRYSVRPGLECRRLDLLRPEPSWPPVAGEYTLRLFLEVDRATQFVELWRNSVRWRVKEVARSRGIQSSLQLSERSGVNKNSANAIWNGTALRIDRDSLGKICHALGCTPGDLLEFVGRPTDEGSA